MNCDQCENTCIIKDIYTREESTCSGCNLGVFSKCSCSYYTVHTQEIWCENCNIQLKSCSHCKKLLNILNINNDHCSQCFEEIKNKDPSTENEIYEFSENRVKWFLVKKRCVFCNTLNYTKFYIKDNIICVNCEIDMEYNILINEYKNIEFDIILKPKYYSFIEFSNLFDIHEYKYFDYYLKFIIARLICKCGNYTKWVYYKYLFCNRDDIIIQCKNCDPSPKYRKYEYNTKYKIWKFEKIGKDCSLCDSVLWKKDDDQYKWGDLIQCDKHKPPNNFIKYIYTISGYNISKIKYLNKKNNRHYWMNADHSITNDYKCECDKCNKI